MDRTVKKKPADTYWIRLIQFRDKGRAFVKTVMDSWV
jgi:hypothetical protein